MEIPYEDSIICFKDGNYVENGTFMIGKNIGDVSYFAYMHPYKENGVTKDRVMIVKIGDVNLDAFSS